MVRNPFDSQALRGPQLVAASLLLIYLLQCLWLVHVQSYQPNDGDGDSEHALRIYQGLKQWQEGVIAGTPESLRAEAVTGLPSAGRAGSLRVNNGFDEDRSPLHDLIASALLLLRPGSWLPQSSQPWLAVAPYLFFGVMLGASLWYVTRRLYGDVGGYIALSFYCFSPAMIVNVAGARSLGEIGAVWGAFGTVFTAIAVAHTLYAPREVVLWNSRRIFLLGLSIALAVGTQFSMAVFAVLILPIMLWVAPVRPRAVVAIWLTVIAVSLVLLLAAYFFDVRLFWQALRHARWFDLDAAALSARFSYTNAWPAMVAGSPPLMLALPATFIAYLAWKRARYFGNTAPLLIAALLLVLSLGAPNFPGQGFQLTLLVFLFVFVSGVFADLLDTRHSPLVAASLCGVLGASAVWNLWALLRLR